MELVWQNARVLLQKGCMELCSSSASSPYTSAAFLGVLLCSPGTGRAGVRPAAEREGMEAQVKAVSILLPDC